MGRDDVPRDVRTPRTPGSETVRSAAGDRRGGRRERIATGEIARRLLRADYGVLRTLERKGLIVATEHERTVEYGGPAFRLPEPDAAPAAGARCAAGAVCRRKEQAALLQGITGSGKTEIYIHLIAETLSRAATCCCWSRRLR